MTGSPREGLPGHAIERIAAFVGPDRGLGAVTRLPPKPLVADYCDKFIALDQAGRPAAFIVLSPASHPRSVLDAVEATRRVAQALGPALADTVLLPHFVGDLDGRSWSITAYRRPMSAGRLSGRWQRLRLRPAALAWLARLTRHTAAPIAALDGEVRAPLQALVEHPAIDAATRAAAASALGELDGGAWLPRSVVAHNDLWWGNFVHRDSPAPAGTPFQVIDWAGADVRGGAIYDLLRLGMSLGMSARQLAPQVDAHCALLGCTRAQSLHYLSLSLARLSRNLGEWPVAQFASTASDCLRVASAALASASRSRSRSDR